MTYTPEQAALAADLVKAEADLMVAILDRFETVPDVVIESAADEDALIRDIGGDIAEKIHLARFHRAAFRESL